MILIGNPSLSIRKLFGFIILWNPPISTGNPLILIRKLVKSQSIWIGNPLISIGNPLILIINPMSLKGNYVISIGNYVISVFLSSSQMGRERVARSVLIESSRIQQSNQDQDATSRTIYWKCLKKIRKVLKKK